MATRLYLPATPEACPMTPNPLAWTSIGLAGRAVMRTNKINDTLANVSVSDASAANATVLLRQYMSLPLAVGQSISASQAFKAQIRISETDAGNNIFATVGLRIIAGDGSSVRRTMLPIASDDVEAAVGTLTNRKLAANTTNAAYTTNYGDRLVFEIGIGGDPAAGKSHSSTIRLGDSAGSDLPEDDTSTTDLNPWMELADTLSFATAPGSPTGLTATTVAIDQINLAWTAPASDGDAPISGYKIERESPTGNGFSVLVADTGSTGTTFSDTGLDADTEYNYRVSALNEVGSSTPSNEDSGTTTGTFPLATLSGSITESAVQRDIRTGATELIISLENATWVSSAGSAFGEESQGILDGITSATFRKRSAIIGGHFLLGQPWLANAANLQVIRNIVKDKIIVDASSDPESAISEAKFGQFNNLSNGPIALIFTIRTPDTSNPDLDNPPEVGSDEFNNVLSALIHTFDAPNDEAQDCISNGRLTIQFFNEISGGPGSFGVEGDLVESYARQARGLAYATAMKAGLVSGVTNGELINFTGAALTACEDIAPGAVPGSDVAAWRQTVMREWVQWCADEGAFVDFHGNCSGLDVGSKSLRPQLLALGAYAASIGWELAWESHEFGPAWVRIDGVVPTTPEGLALVAEEERLLWNYALAWNPRLLVRVPFVEQYANTEGFIAYSAVDSNLEEKAPFSELLSDEIAKEFDADLPLRYLGFDLNVFPKLSANDISRDSDTQITITVPAVLDYTIFEQETISVIVPDNALDEGYGPIVATPDFTLGAPAVPDVPTSLTATTVSQGRIDLAWTAPADDGGADIIGYKVEMETPTGGGFSVRIANTGKTATIQQISGLMAETEYNFRVSAINQMGSGAPSNEDADTTDESTQDNSAALILLKTG